VSAAPSGGLALPRWRRAVLPAAVVAGALMMALCFLWPIFSNAWSQTHDMVAYPVRAIEYVAGWRSGAFWPRWAPDLYGGFGCPLFNFYAPGLFVVSGIFMLFGASAVWALKLALIVLTAAGAAGVFGVVYHERRRADAAAVAAAVFVFMGYHVTLVFVRGDLAEYSAICLTPSVIWAYRALGRVSPSQLLPVGLAAAFLHAATLLVHTLTGQWLTELLAIIAAVAAWPALRRRDRARVIAIGVTFVCACGLTAIYTVPALLERPLVHIERMTEGGLATTRNLIPLAHLSSVGFFYVGWAMISLPLFFVAVLVRRRRIVRDLLVWTALAVLMLLLMLPLAKPVWSWLPFGAYIQFPWRLLGFLSVFGALAWGSVWSELVPDRRIIAWTLAVVATGAVVYNGRANMPVLAPIPDYQIPASAADIGHGIHSTVISDEYVPRVVPVAPNYPRSAFVVAHDGNGIESSLRSGTGYRLEVSADAGSTVDVRALFFPGWKVSVRGGPAGVTLEPSEAGFVRVRFPVKGYYRIYVYFGLTPLRAAATAASFVSLLVLVVALRRLRRDMAPAPAIGNIG
jgi:hypothetical protein